MDPITTGIGAAALGYGSYTFYLRTTMPAKLTKLTAMREKLGASAGTAIHVVAYSVLPIAFGLAMLFAGWQGVSFL